MRFTVRLLLALMLIMISIPSGSPGPTRAQDSATPVAPDLGEPVTFIDFEGNERGVVTLLEITDPYTDFVVGQPPAEGFRYVVTNVSFEATGATPFDANPNSVWIRDTNGFTWVPAYVPRFEPIIPDAQSQTLAPGNKISGAINYVLPVGVEIGQFFYQPVGNQIILLADLAPSTESLALGTAVPYSNAEDVDVGTVSVVELSDPFEGNPPDQPAAQGSRYVVLVVSFEATGEGLFDTNPASIWLRDSDGFIWSPVFVPRALPLTVADAQPQILSPGDKVSGAIGYLLPEGAVVSEVFYQPVSNQIIQIAEV